MMRSAIASQEMAGDPMGLRSAVFQFGIAEVKMKTFWPEAVGRQPIIGPDWSGSESTKAHRRNARAGILSALHQDSGCCEKHFRPPKCLGTVRGAQA